MAIWLLGVFASFFGLSVYAIVRQQRALAEDQRVEGLIAEAVATLIADAPPSGRVRISGRVAGVEGATVTAPFSGDQVLWARATTQSNVGEVTQGWVEAVPEIVVDDGSGRAARVRTEGARMRLPEAKMDGRRYLEERGLTEDSDTSLFHYEAAIRPGDLIDIVGTVSSSESTYRESGAAPMRLSALDGELLFSDPAWEHRAPERHERGRGCAIATAVVFAAALMITALATFAR